MLITQSKSWNRLIAQRGFLGSTLRHHILEELRIKSAISDEVLYFAHFGKTVMGKCATYVDACFYAGGQNYSKLIQNTEEIFQ